MLAADWIIDGLIPLLALRYRVDRADVLKYSHVFLSTALYQAREDNASNKAANDKYLTNQNISLQYSIII